MLDILPFYILPNSTNPQYSDWAAGQNSKIIFEKINKIIKNRKHDDISYYYLLLLLLLLSLLLLLFIIIIITIIIVFIIIITNTKSANEYQHFPV